jgi:hypothetical protein
MTGRGDYFLLMANTSSVQLCAFFWLRDLIYSNTKGKHHA